VRHARRQALAAAVRDSAWFAAGVVV